MECMNYGVHLLHFKIFYWPFTNDEAHPIFLVEARYTAFSATGESVFQPPRNSHLKMDDLGVSLS